MRGFTLVELMIALGIVGILAAGAAVAYRDQVIKAKSAGLLSTAGGYKMLVGSRVSENGRMPKLDPVVNPTDMVRRIVFDRRSCSVLWMRLYPSRQFDRAFTRHQLLFEGVLRDNGSIQWRCGPRVGRWGLPAEHLPANCRDTIQNVRRRRCD